MFKRKLYVALLVVAGAAPVLAGPPAVGDGGVAQAATVRGGEVRATVASAQDEKPVSAARVTVTDAKGVTSTALTDEHGVAHFKDLPPGDYVVEVNALKFESDRSQVHVDSDKVATFSCYLDVAGGEKVLKITERRSIIDNTDPAGGNQIKTGKTFMDQGIADGRNLQSVLNTAPGMQSDANGQVHIRGEHKSIDFRFDGLNIPNGLSSNYTSLIDPRYFDEVDVKLGNYDATEFGQLGAVVDLKTEEGKVKPWIEYRQGVGDHSYLEEMLSAAGSNEAGTFNYVVGGRLSGTSLHSEPVQPNFQSGNNIARDDNFMVRLTGKPSDQDHLALTAIHQDSTAGTPQDLNSYLAGVRQELFDHNTLVTFAWDHKFSQTDALKLGLVYFENEEHYRNNGVYTPFTVFPASVSSDLNSSNAPLDPTNPGSPYLPTSDLSVRQIQPQVEWKHDFGPRNTLKVGANADFITSDQSVSIIDAGGGGGLPVVTSTTAAGAPMFNANVARNGFFGGVYFSHSVPLGPIVSLNYGARADEFNNGLGISVGQISPRVNLLVAPDDRSALRLSYNSLFQPPPLELDVSGLTTSLPQSTQQWELNYQREVAPHIAVSFGGVYKLFRNGLDVGLLVPNSQVPLFAPLNYDRAYYRGLEVTVNTRFKQGLNGFFSGTWGLARPTAGSLFEGNVVGAAYNDHDQRFQMTGGISQSWGRGWEAESDFLFGTGFPQDTLNSYNAVGVYPYGINTNGGRIPHFSLNASISYFPQDADGKREKGPGFQAQVLNIFDSRADYNFLSGFSGTRFQVGRQLRLNALYRF